jgi:transcriptional regulator with XRE-family HTH domain
MGQSSRPVPARLAEKLLLVRTGLRLSQNELISHLGLGDELTQARVSAYERGVREPPLLVLLMYARAANVSVEALIDDELDLPKKLPASPKSEGIKKRRILKSGTGGKPKPNRA